MKTTTRSRALLAVALVASLLGVTSGNVTTTSRFETRIVATN